MMETLKGLFSQSPILVYGKDQLIIHANDIPSGIFYIQKGFIKKTAIHETGREITLRLYRKHSIFPLIWAFTGSDHYYYRTVTPVELQKVSRDFFVSFLQSHPKILFELTKQILIQDNELLTNIAHQLSGDSYHRVVAAVALCMRRFGTTKKHNNLVITLPLTHKDIADITGLTRESVSVVMMKLKKKRIITSFDHSICIKDMDALTAESTLDSTDF